MNLTQNEINWIANEFKAKRTLDEIALDTRMSVQNVKRALAEAKLMTLHWYKTKEENKILSLIRDKGITLKQLESM